MATTETGASNATGRRQAPRMARCCTLVLLTAIAGCGSQSTIRSVFDNVADKFSGPRVGQLPPKPADRAWPDPANDVLNERARGNGLIVMPEMTRYLDGLYAKLKVAAHAAEWPGSVYVTAASDLDAYSTAAGNIYLSVAWLLTAESEDEIVALLAHEFGHVYLDSHRLATAYVTADRAAALAALGVALARKTADSTKWTPVDNLMASYALGRNTLGPAWSRSEEEGADRFGMTLSLQLNYSYPSGFKAFLERIAAWEADNAERRKTERERLAQAREQSTAARMDAAVQSSRALERPGDAMKTALDAGVGGATEAFKSGVGDFWEKITSTHPSTEDRIALLTEQVVPLLKDKPRPASTVASWTAATARPRTAALLKSYESLLEAHRALQQQQVADSRRFALLGASGAAATQAFPVLTLAMTEAASGGLPTAPAQSERRRGAPAARASAANVLDRNLASESDRAWKVYVMRAHGLLETGQTAQARTVLENGFSYFRKAPAAWPDAIRFVGETGDWRRARTMADDCSSRYPAWSKTCNEAATSPPEQAKAEAIDKSKSKNVMQRIFNFRQ